MSRRSDLPKVAILGGGVTGLSAAYYLEQLTNFEIDLYEAANRLGGKIATETHNGYLVESSADSIFLKPNFPQWEDLAKALDLEAEIIEPSTSGFSIRHNGQLHQVPRELLNFANLTEEALAKATFLTQEGKRRALQQSPTTQEDQSVAAFFRRKYGDEFSKLVIEPVLAGTHSGHPERLSMQALYPQYLHNQPTAPTKFFSFKNGCQTLTDQITKALQRARIHLQTTTPRAHDHLILAIPAYLLGIPNQLPTTDTTVVTIGVPHQLDLHGTGFLVPQGEPGPLRAATYTSNKWPHRAPPNSTLIRVFLKPGTENPQQTALNELNLPNPDFIQTTRHTQPLYTLGHLDRVKALRAQTNAHLIGASYGGVGILDCVRQGYETAVKIAGAQ